MESIIEERIEFKNGLLTLAGILGYPQEQAVQRAALLCSPHPHFAGNMDNNVISAVAKTLAQDFALLRFDYRGVGQSRILLAEGISVFDYWEQVETSRDYSDALNDVQAAFEALTAMINHPALKILAAGYSFGAAVALKYGINSNHCDILVGVAPPLGKIDFSFLSQCRKPCLLLIGNQDFLYSPDAIEKLQLTVSPNVKIEILPDCDHFFRGDEQMLARLIQDFVMKQMNKIEVV